MSKMELSATEPMVRKWIRATGTLPDGSRGLIEITLTQKPQVIDFWPELIESVDEDQACHFTININPDPEV